MKLSEELKLYKSSAFSFGEKISKSRGNYSIRLKERLIRNAEEIEQYLEKLRKLPDSSKEWSKKDLAIASHTFLSIDEKYDRMEGRYTRNQIYYMYRKLKKQQIENEGS